ncbi:class I SAM-dependent methyltransferase [Streptomyces sp. RY43-2]|uniref:Class I SAM-dependent methyltransferase n=1 Tax=Streptomyces macrolidinus TaxID=2952607 RepID=A0ABT0ZMC4_9ACTN|nr:class I SAM-dependent methyltransferase [Streptomyces macrolidinus]MCN9244734.1 class I SAM-dependent methyltransferase [Streptomyces macrolidinus]
MPRTAEPAVGYTAYRRVVADSFGTWYGRRRDSWTGTDTNEAVTRFVCAEAPAPRAEGRRRILDVGCGRGRQTTALAERLDADTTGLDLLDVWDAPPPTRGQVRFRQGDFLDFTDDNLDIVVDNGCLHHQRRADWPAWAAHGARLLRPGGVLAVSVFLSPDGAISELPLDDGRLNWWLPEETVTDLYTRAGLTATGRQVIDRDFQYQGHWLSYLALSFRKAEG